MAQAEPSGVLSDNLAYAGHPVLREILKRAKGTGVRCEARNVKLGLVIEGGGMRGVVSGGALVAMERLGFSEIFDEVYGESAGAINACYFLAKQASFGIQIYFDDLTSLKFVNPLRFRRMLNLDYAIDEAVGRRKALDVEKVLESPSRLSIAITNALDGTTRMVDVKKENIPLLTLLKATGAIAPLYSIPVTIDGRPYVDGGIVNPIPVASAIQEGCTHILVLLTRTPEFVSTGYRPLSRFFVTRLFRGWDRRFVKAFFESQSPAYNLARSIAFGRVQRNAKVNIAVIAPDKTCPPVSLTTVSRSRLTAASDYMAHRTSELFAATPV